MTARLAPIPTTKIPMTFRMRGGKTVMVLPDGSRAVAQREATIDNTMVKVLARGFRWQRLLYDGTHATIEDMAAAEKINPSYISRLMRLAYLSPAIVEAILDGRHPAHLTMKDLMEPFPLDWAAQERHFLAHRPEAGGLSAGPPEPAPSIRPRTVQAHLVSL